MFCTALCIMLLSRIYVPGCVYLYLPVFVSLHINYVKQSKTYNWSVWPVIYTCSCQNLFKFINLISVRIVFYDFINELQGKKNKKKPQKREKNPTTPPPKTGEKTRKKKDQIFVSDIAEAVTYGILSFHCTLGSSSSHKTCFA